MNAFKKYAVKRSDTTLDKYGQMRKDAFETIAEVSIAVFLKADNELANNPLYSAISHIGVYKGSFADFRKHDRLDNQFEVRYVIQGKRKVLLYLSEVIS